MHWIVKQLLIPTTFFTIRHGENNSRNKVYNFVIPGLFACLFTCIQMFKSSPLLIVKDKGIFDTLSPLFSLFAAFFIAALAAVATFQNGEIDKEMKSGDKSRTFFERNNSFGEPQNIYLSRRQYLCYLFGYLSFATIVFVLTVSLFTIFKDVAILNNSTGLFILNSFLTFSFWFMMVQILLLTLLGLGFLTEKINGPL